MLPRVLHLEKGPLMDILPYTDVVFLTKTHAQVRIFTTNKTHNFNRLRPTSVGDFRPLKNIRLYFFIEFL